MQDIQTNTNKYSAAQSYLRETVADSGSGDSGSRKWVILGFLVSATLIGFIAFIATFVLNGATISIKPVKKDLQINETLVVTPEDRATLLSPKEIAATETITLPKNSLKQVSARAKGTITIYNNYDAKSQKLIKGTRFATSDGKIFRIQEGVTVPAKSGSTPGSVQASVVADSEGEDYNIGPTRFTIPGFKGSPKYNGFYGESSKAMTGGSSGKTSGVSDLDMENGKATVSNKLKTSLADKLSKSAPDGFTFSADTVFISYGAMNLIDSDNTTATYEMPATATAVYLKQDQIIKGIVEKTQNVDTSSASISILSSDGFVISVVDPSDIADPQKPVRLIVTGTAPVVFKPNPEKVIDFIVGKSKSEFSEITKKIQFVESAKSTIRPFWFSNFPSDRDKINVVIEE